MRPRDRPHGAAPKRRSWTSGPQRPLINFAVGFVGFALPRLERMPVIASALSVSLLTDDLEPATHEVFVELEFALFVGRRELVEIHAIAPVAGHILPTLLFDRAHCDGGPVRDNAQPSAAVSFDGPARHVLHLEIAA